MYIIVRHGDLIGTLGVGLSPLYIWVLILLVVKLTESKPRRVPLHKAPSKDYSVVFFAVWCILDVIWVNSYLLTGMDDGFYLFGTAGVLLVMALATIPVQLAEVKKYHI